MTYSAQQGSKCSNLVHNNFLQRYNFFFALLFALPGNFLIHLKIEENHQKGFTDPKQVKEEVHMRFRISLIGTCY